jgi:beta-lactamase superfamily II metal-dependent hydrolase
MATKVSATVRMYRLNELGDCFLLTFKNGSAQSTMLIDFGSFRNSPASSNRLKEILKDIHGELKGKPLDVVVGTHQHNDHVSGFAHCQTELKKVGIDQVWLSWLDDPKDCMARDIGAKHHNLALALHSVQQKLANVSLTQRGARAAEVIEDMLGFYGASNASKAPPAFPAEAVAILKTLGKQEPRYFRPGTIADMPGMPSGSVKVYVLGPPRDGEKLYKKDPKTGQSYDLKLSLAHLSARKLLDAAANRRGEQSAEEAEYPFDRTLKQRDTGEFPAALATMVRTYRDKGDAWRTIDDDWMQEVEALALYLDSFTNNSSLVLAIELVESGKVMIFAADAQIGNWESWAEAKWSQASCRTDDLLQRTILYKVGHHGSHNATLVDAFEKMTHPHLSAVIPVHKKDPNITKPNGWKMPARRLLGRLIERTSGRVLQMDDEQAPGCDPTKSPAKEAWAKAGIKPRVTDLYFELPIQK